MEKRLVLLACASLLIAGCGMTVRQSKIGKNYPAKAASCEIDFEHVNPTRPQDPGRYEVIAQVQLTPVPVEPVYTAEMKKVLRERACRLGGDIVRYRTRVDHRGRTSGGFDVEVDTFLRSTPPPPPDEQAPAPAVAAEPVLDAPLSGGTSLGPTVPP